MTSNLSLGATVTHVFFWHWRDIKPFLKTFNPWNKTPLEVHDPHYEKMKVYKQIPRWWYFAVLAGAYAIAMATNYTGHSGMPWWALTVLVIISFIFCALYGTLAATIGFYQFSSSGTGFFQMITGACFSKLRRSDRNKFSCSVPRPRSSRREHVWCPLRPAPNDSGYRPYARP